MGNLFAGRHELFEDDVPEDLLGVDTASDNDTEALIPPKPPDYITAAEPTYRQVMLEQETRDEGQLSEDAGLMMHILSQGFQTAIERTLDKSLENVQKHMDTNQRETTTSTRNWKDEMQTLISLKEEEMKQMMRETKRDQDAGLRGCMQAVHDVRDGVKNDMANWKLEARDRERVMTKELTVSLNQDLKESVQKMQDMVELNKTTMQKQFQELSVGVQQVRDHTIKSLVETALKKDTSHKQIYERVTQLETTMQRPMPADSSFGSSQRDRCDSSTRMQKSASLSFQDSFECPPDVMNNTADDSAPTRSRPTVRLSTAPLVMHESTRKHNTNKRGRDSDSDDDGAQCMASRRQSPRGRHDRYDDMYRAVPPTPPPNIHQATGIPKYHGVQQSGHIDDWLETVDQAGEAYHYTEAQKKFSLITLLDPPIKKHLKTYCDVATTSYRQMCALLKRRVNPLETHSSSTSKR